MRLVGKAKNCCIRVVFNSVPLNLSLQALRAEKFGSIFN